jgi:leucyl-tRNA synthetase
VVPVPESQLPVELPYDVTFDKPGNPLAHHPTWKDTTCPTCHAKAERETDTFDTFFESSWYFARYTDPNNTKIGFAPEKAAYWLPVDQYIGGVEHAVLHLLYSRFFTRALSECGYMDTPEPFAGLYTQGMINHMTFKDKDGKWVTPKDVMKDESGNWVMVAGTHEPVTSGRVEKMSKSKKNTIDPQDILDTYGADAARMFILSDSPPDRDLEWTESGLDGAWRFINRLNRLVTDNKETMLKPATGKSSDAAQKLQQKTHQTLAKVAEDIEAFHMNKAVARLRELTNMIEAFKPEAGDTEIYREAIEYTLRGLNPMIPHITEELWSVLGNPTLLVKTPWPKINSELLVEDSVVVAIQINGKLKTTITLPINTPKAETEKIAMNDARVITALEGKTIRKVVVVPNKIVNVVAG